MSPPRSPTGSGHHNPKALTDLSTDAFALCTRLLSLRDVSNLAMSSKSLRLLAYSDAVWFRLLQDRWPNYCMSSGAGGAREEYLSRFTAMRQFKFCDPAIDHLWAMPVPPTQILLAKNEIWVDQGRHVINVACSSDPHFANHQMFRAHNARITCMRLFPISETSFFRSEMQRDDTILATSSSDRTIRLWWKGSPQRCFKGHSGPVTVLADTLLGDCGSKFLVSGGEDSTVRLWSVGSGRMHGHPAVTYHGHEKSISFLSAASLVRAMLVVPSKEETYYSKCWSTMRKKLMKYIVLTLIILDSVFARITLRFGLSRNIMTKDYVCGKIGFKKWLKITETVKYKRAETRTGCPAMIRYGVDEEGNWTVKKLIESHNHPLANPGDKHLLRSSRKISEVNADVLRSMSQSGIRPKDAFNFLAQEVGGVENLECTKTDAFNFIQRERRCKIKNGDVNALLQLFAERRAEDNMFEWDFETDVNGRLMNFFFERRDIHV